MSQSLIVNLSVFIYMYPIGTISLENPDSYTKSYLNWKNSVNQPGLCPSGVTRLPEDLNKPGLPLLHLTVNPNASLSVRPFKPRPSHTFSPSVSNVLRHLTFYIMKGLPSNLFITGACLFPPIWSVSLISGKQENELSRAAHAMTTRGSRNLARGMHC